MNRCYSNFLVSLLLNGIKTLIVCALILWVFHQSVSQRVFTIAKHLRQFDPFEPTHEPLDLTHRKFIMEKNDELDCSPKKPIKSPYG